MNIKISKNLPSAELDHLNVGYMRLTDSAPLIVAQHLGLYEKFGLNLTCTGRSPGPIFATRPSPALLMPARCLPMPLVTTSVLPVFAHP